MKFLFLISFEKNISLWLLEKDNFLIFLKSTLFQIKRSWCSCLRIICIWRFLYLMNIASVKKFDAYFVLNEIKIFKCTWWPLLKITHSSYTLSIDSFRCLYSDPWILGGFQRAKWSSALWRTSVSSQQSPRRSVLVFVLTKS